MGAACANCGAAIGGRFCAGCGQDARLRLTFRELAGQALGGLFNLDSRFWATLRDLAVPGRMTAAYLAGRRARYMPPVQTYLVVALIFFAIVPAGLDSLFINLVMRDSIEANAARAGIAPPDEARRWLASAAALPTGQVEFQRGVTLFSWLMFVTMPLFAALLHAVHLAQRRDFLEHLVVAVQLQTVAFALGALALIGEIVAWRLWLPRPTLVLQPLMFATLAVYGAFAVRRVYGEGLAIATLKLAAAGLANLLFLVLAVRAVTLVAERSLA